MNRVRRGQRVSFMNRLGMSYQKWSWICGHCGREWALRYLAERCQHTDDPVPWRGTTQYPLQVLERRWREQQGG